MTGFELYFSDLETETQAKLLEELGLDHPQDADWHELPIALINPTNNPELR